MLRIMADMRKRMEFSVPMTTADIKANAFHFQGKGNRRQFLKSLLHSIHGL